MKEMIACFLSTGLITSATILHIVCIATPHYSCADLGKMNLDFKDMDLPERDLDILRNASALGRVVENGIWKFCIQDRRGDDERRCYTYNGSRSPGYWLSGAQAMGILGFLSMGIAMVMAGLRLVWVARDSHPHPHTHYNRLVPTVVCGVCCLGGLVTLCGDIIIAANFRSDVNAPIYHHFLSEGVKYVFSQQFGLDWGFGLDIASCILACVAGIMAVLENAGKKHTDGIVGLVNEEEDV